ncbi:hypothetical protein VT84_11955 [Gemmata sp. SH-PL17]|nr:hypothetical protein VT84_11955 [Gemmata sp. SH-PL17]
MTEAQWLVSEEPRDLLTALRGRASGRKLALYDCALRRFCSRLRVSESPLEAIGVAEEFADRDHAWARTGGAEARYYEESSEYLLSRTVDYAARLAQFVVEYTERRPCPPLIDLPHGSRAIERHVTAARTSFLRDLFGNPFRPITFPPGMAHVHRRCARAADVRVARVRRDADSGRRAPGRGLRQHRRAEPLPR